MDVDSENQPWLAKRERLVERLDQLVASGRLTEEEGGRLRDAKDASDFDDAVRAIRVRHAGMKLDTALTEGDVTREEADDFLERLRNGEHPRSLPAHLRKHRSST